MTEFHGKFEDMTEKEQDKIINPKHYVVLPAGFYEKDIEYMDIMEHVLRQHDGIIGHLLGQAFKYMFRLDQKDSLEQDAKKIEWYANRLVKVIKARNEKIKNKTQESDSFTLKNSRL